MREGTKPVYDPGIRAFEVVLTNGLRFTVGVQSEAALKNLILADAFLPATPDGASEERNGKGWRVYAPHIACYREESEDA
jgi:hypothetical protein